MDPYEREGRGDGDTTKEPWFAVFLSDLLAGAGQLYGGKKTRGVAFLIAALVLFLVLVASVYGFLSTANARDARFLALTAAFSVCIAFVFHVYVLVDAYTVTKKAAGKRPCIPEPNDTRKPWLAVFLSSLFPGIGQFYNRDRLKGAVLLAAAVALHAAETERAPLFLLLAPVSFFSLLDAFDSAHKRGGSPERFMRQGKPLLIFVAAMIAFHSIPFGEFVRAHGVKAYRISAGSMLPTLNVGDRILADTSKNAVRSLIRGDVIVFRYPLHPEQEFIKRVIGTEGDRIEITNGVLRINEQDVLAAPTGPDAVDAHELEHEHPRPVFYQEWFGAAAHRIQRLMDPAGMRGGPWLVPKNSVFVMGDNRDNSVDSRHWGFVSVTDVEGKALKIYWSRDSKTGRVLWDRIGLTIR